MKTLIAIMQYVGVVLTAFGFVYAVGMMVADELFKRALGASAYYDVDAISPWEITGVLVLGTVILVISYIMDGIFRAGEKYATKETEEQDDGV